MRRRLVLISTLIALAVGAWLVAVQLGREDDVTALERTQESATAEHEKRDDELDTVANQLPELEVSNARETVESATEPTDATPPTGPTCRIFGRVQDENEKPIEGVKVFMNSVGEPWAPGVSESKFETRSGVDGTFELLTPLPTSSWISLTLEPSPFHMLGDQNFGVAGGRNKDPLAEGDNDLGSFTLASAGTIAGFIRSADGRPFDKVRVRLDGSFPGGRSLGQYADDAGRYEIAHIPAGTYNIEGISTGYLTSGLKLIEVQAGVTSGGHDIVLEPAPFISGRVVDSLGQPIEKVKVWGWPLSSGQGAGARTDEHGEFTVYFPQAEPYSFGAKKQGYVSFGENVGRKGVIYEPGTTGILIEMKSELATTFLVVDASSGLPIERYGLDINERPEKGWSSSASREPVPLADHPLGEFSTFADPERHDLRIQALGFAPQRISVEHDAENAGRQTIRMQAEGRLEGRVLLDGKPVTGASVRVERARIPLEGETRPEVDDIFNSKMTYDLDDYLGRLRILATDAQGRFAVGELASGTYQVEVSTADSAPFVVEEVSVVASEKQDMGDLQLVLGVRVFGTVVLTEGVNPLGVEVCLDDTWSGKKAIVNARGEFELLGVSPGEHTLQTDFAKGIVGRSDPIPIQVAAGRPNEVQLDLRPWQMGKVRVHVHEAGQPLEGVNVSIQHKNGGSVQGNSQTNRDGDLLIDTQNGEVGKFVAISADGLVLGESQKSLVVLPGREIQVEIAVTTALLTIRLPADFELPELATLDISILSGTTQLVSFHLGSRSTSPDAIARRAQPLWDSTVVPLGRIAAGTLTIVATVRVRENSEGGRQVIVSTQKFGAEIEARAGEQVTCDLKLLEEKKD